MFLRNLSVASLCFAVPPCAYSYTYSTVVKTRWDLDLVELKWKLDMDEPAFSPKYKRIRCMVALQEHNSRLMDVNPLARFWVQRDPITRKHRYDYYAGVVGFKNYEEMSKYYGFQGDDDMEDFCENYFERMEKVLKFVKKESPEQPKEEC
jgi:hypothetical protein